MATHDSGAVSRREIAVARVLDPARSRAETRLQRFLDAALALMAEPGRDFTVQEVVERSGQSLRGFYQYFGGKDDLLLALFEDSVRTTAELLRAEVELHDEPRERLRRFVLGYHAACRQRAENSGLMPVFAGLAHRLLTEHPEEAARAFLPLADLCDELLQAAVEAGWARRDLPPVAPGVLLQATMFSPFAEVIGGPGAPDGAEALWDLLSAGLRAS